MGAYADQIAKLLLVKLLEKSGGRDEISDTDVKKLHAAVLEAADIVGPLLDRIPVTFKQYTEHNLAHSVNLIKLMGKFIPAKTQKKLNALEFAVLILSAMLHDLGMFVSDEERDTFLRSDEFTRFVSTAPEKERAITEARDAAKHVMARVIEDALIADYFRRFHPERARLHIEEHLGAVLRFREYSLVDAVARICESHGWGVFESTDPRHPEKAIVKLNSRHRVYDVPFNEQYIAAALRLADIMDFDRSRTPLSLLKTIDFTEAKSQAEWQKHLQIKGWEVSDRDVGFQAECEKPEHYVAVMDFLEWIDAELRDCRRLLVRLAPQDIAERYLFHLPPAVDRIHVEMADKSFIAGAFRFELDYERIMKLLMDRSLYPDPSLFLRELLQNSLDACRVRMALAKSEAAGDKYTPRIAVWDRVTDGARTIVFQDNGVGMSRATIENYFMRVGRSYYRSNEFHAERKRLAEKGVELEATSQFGIGFLSSFMVADKIEIETYRHGHTPIQISVEGPTKFFTMKVVEAPHRPEFLTQGATIESDGPPCFPGTRVTLHLRPGIELDVRQTLETFAVNVEVPVSIITDGNTADVPVFGWRGDPMNFVPVFSREAVLIYEDGPALFPAWSNLLIPLAVPLRRYDFCDGLDGRAWFWMLRDARGSATPCFRYLKIDNTLRTTGLPRAASGLSRANPRRDIAALSVDNFLPADLTVEEDLRDFWNGSDSVTRRQILDHSELARGAPYWHRNHKALEALTRDDYSWLTVHADYDGGDIYVCSPAQYALHGISLPGGITHWNPMKGSADRLTLLQFPAGFVIDVRKHAPTPAANRLFVSPQDAAPVAIALLRAFIAFALDLLDEHSDDSDWNEWGAGFLAQLPNSPWVANAVLPQYERIETRFPFTMREGKDILTVTRDELRTRFGSIVHFTMGGEDDGLLYTGANRLLLMTKYALVSSEDGRHRYDLDTEQDWKTANRDYFAD